MIFSVADFFQNEEDKREPFNYGNVVRRTAETCAVSEKTVIHCEQPAVEWISEQRENTMSKWTKEGRPEIETDEFT